MKRVAPISVLLFAVVGLLCQCKAKYVSPYVVPNVGYLVVEGFISGNVPIKYTLTRTLPLPGDSTVPPEKGAEVEVEGNDNSIYRLIEQKPGVYNSADTPGLNRQANYRLRIHTSNGEDYLSDFVPFKPSPPIDSINWVYGPEGVTIYANAHDISGSSRYYQWGFDETWQYNSAEYSFLKYDSTDSVVVWRQPADQIFTCWHDLASSTIILGSSIKLAQDVIYEQPLEQFPASSQKLSVLYTTLVSQWVLTDSAYNYASIMQKNTESLGSIFDAQPSSLMGNIHCLTRPGEQVIGYISAGTVQQQRIWISVSQLPGWSYVSSCPEQDVVLNGAIAEYQDFYYGSLTPVAPATQPGTPGGVSANQTYCVDCRAQGGMTYPPPFWPN
jgi:Domain of unknown function (DUF4249)